MLLYLPLVLLMMFRPNLSAKRPIAVPSRPRKHLNLSSPSADGLVAS